MASEQRHRREGEVRGELPVQQEEGNAAQPHVVLARCSGAIGGEATPEREGAGAKTTQDPGGAGEMGVGARALQRQG